MKTFVATLCALALLYFLSLPKPFNLSQGDLNSISVEDPTFSISYDYSDTQIYDNSVGHYLSLNQYVQNHCLSDEIVNDVYNAEQAFITSFNSSSKKGTIVSSDNADYEMSFKLDEFCYGKPGGGVTTNSKGWATGTVSVKDTTTGEVLLTYKFNKLVACPPGKSSLDLNKHRERGYQLVANYVAKSLNENK